MIKSGQDRSKSHRPVDRTIVLFTAPPHDEPGFALPSAASGAKALGAGADLGETARVDPGEPIPHQPFYCEERNSGGRRGGYYPRWAA